VVSAGMYINHLHFAPDRQPCQQLITQFIQAGGSINNNNNNLFFIITPHLVRERSIMMIRFVCDLSVCTHISQNHASKLHRILYMFCLLLWLSVTRYSSCASSFVEFNPKRTGNKTNNPITNRD